MLKRYLKAQGTVLLFGGLVGPIFLAVYFALGQMARPYINWMFWVGLFITAADVLAALALANDGAKSQALHDDSTQQGLLAAGSGSAPAAAPTVSQRLDELETLHATGVVTEAEYADKRNQILSEL